MNVLKGLIDLTNSERGVQSVAVLVCATVLCGLGVLSPELWAATAVGAQGIHAWGKTVRPGGAAALAAGPSDPKESEKPPHYSDGRV